MLMGSNAKWWGDFGTRHASHEGLDIVMYKDRQGNINLLTPDIEIPAMADCTILNICRDFLASSVVTKFSSPNSNPAGATDLSNGSASISGSTEKTELVAVYSHIIPGKNLHSGQRLRKYEHIGSIADTSKKKSGIPCHLHISIIELAQGIPVNMLDWRLFGDHSSDKVNLINPLWFNISDI